MLFCSIDPRIAATPEEYDRINTAAFKAGVAAANAMMAAAQAPVAAVPAYSVLTPPIGKFEVASAYLPTESLMKLAGGNPFKTDQVWGYTVAYTLQTPACLRAYRAAASSLCRRSTVPAGQGPHFDIDETKTYSHTILPVYPGRHPKGPATLSDRPYGGDHLGNSWSITVAADYQVNNPATGVYSDTILGCVSITFFDALALRGSRCRRLTVGWAGRSNEETSRPNVGKMW